MRSAAIVTCLLAASLLLPASASAQEEEVTGEVRVTMNVEYAKVRLNGEEYSAVEFERGGKVAVVKNLDLSEMPMDIEIQPADDTYAPQTFKVERKDFKRKRRKRVYVYVATLKAKFKKKPGDDKPQPKPEPKPKPDKKPEKPDPDEL